MYTTDIEALIEALQTIMDKKNDLGRRTMVDMNMHALESIMRLQRHSLLLTQVVRKSYDTVEIEKEDEII